MYMYMYYIYTFYMYCDGNIWCIVLAPQIRDSLLQLPSFFILG